MGKSKRFIAKGEGSHFHLMHRSQTDKAHAGEETPSNFVLVLSDKNKTSQMGNKKFDFEDYLDKASSVKSNRGLKTIDHVDSLGFKNDGYDYSKHLKEMGGGKFISKDGAVQNLEYHTPLVLPEDSLPSGEELVRDLRAITISHEVMDDDIEAALFGEDEQFEEFEELQDDFVQFAMQEPEEPDFDFDAHIAKLIERSERMALGIPEKNEEKTYSHDRGDDDEDEEDLSLGFDLADELTQCTMNTEIRNRHFKLKNISKEQRAALETEFERTLLEYEDEEIGDVEHAFYDESGGEVCEDTETIRTVETNGIDVLQNNEIFNRAMDDFIKMEKDTKLVDGITIKKGLRRIEALEEKTSEEHDYHHEYESQIAAQEEFEARMDELSSDHKYIESCQEYLREEVVREEWDCESILSTYSTLDNHPAVIKTPSVKGSRSGLSEVGSTATSTQSWVSEGGRSYRGKVRPEKVYEKTKTYTMPIISGSSQTARIMLIGNLQLPAGFQNSKPRQVSRQASSIERLSAISLEESYRDSKEKKNSVESDAETESNNEDGSSEDDEIESRIKDERLPRPKETAEEKSLRKQRVKEEKRAKRASKKQLKLAYKEEYLTQVANRAKAQDINSVRVFKYTV